MSWCRESCLPHCHRMPSARFVMRFSTPSTMLFTVVMVTLACTSCKKSDRDAGSSRTAAPPGADSGGKDWKTLIQTLDRGTFDMRKFLKTLFDSGYTGPIGFQGYGIGGDAHDNLKRTMDAWRELNDPAM